MAVSIRKARDFVYSNGTLWEQALFAYRFQGGSLERLHQCIACYRNADGGWGHGMEHDIRTPDSHPLALEFALTLFAREPQIPAGDLFDAASAWVVANQNADGSLRNPPSVVDYPHAAWWKPDNDDVASQYGGQHIPESIAGNLNKFGKASPQLLKNTRKWIEANVSIKSIQSNDWLFMAYHGFDYFMNVDDFPNVEAYRQAVVDNVVTLAGSLPDNQLGSLFTFAPTPDSSIAKALPEKTITKALDYLMETQQDEGHWEDQHNLSQWYPMATIGNLMMLSQYGRISIT